MITKRYTKDEVLDTLRKLIETDDYNSDVIRGMAQGIIFGMPWDATISEDALLLMQIIAKKEVELI